MPGRRMSGSRGDGGLKVVKKSAVLLGNMIKPRWTYVEQKEINVSNPWVIVLVDFLFRIEAICRLMSLYKLEKYADYGSRHNT